MKRTVILLGTLLSLFYVSKGQISIGNFENNTTQGWYGWVDAPTAVANPNSSGINTSAYCLEMVQTVPFKQAVSAWNSNGHFYCLPDSVTVDVYTTNNCSLQVKIGNSLSGGADVDKTVEVVGGAWNKVTFNLTDLKDYDYCQMAFLCSDNNTFYIDNVMVYEKRVVISNFEDNTAQGWSPWSGSATCVANPDTTGINTSKYCLLTKLGGSWNAVAKYIGEGYFKFTPRKVTFDINTDTVNNEFLQFLMFDSKSGVGDKGIGGNIAGGSWRRVNADFTSLTTIDYRQLGVQIGDSLFPFYIDNIFYYSTLSTDATEIVLSDITTIPMGIDTTIQATVKPETAMRDLVWSVTNGTGKATIDKYGVLSPTSPGTVVVKASTVDGSSVTAEKTITIVEATSIAISSSGDATEITTNGGTLQMNATITPAEASQGVVWSFVESADADTASISDKGLLTAIRNGSVDVIATTVDGTNLSDTMTITLTNQVVEPLSLVIADATVNTNDTPVQLTIESSDPTDADKSVTWSIVSVNEADTATITADGILTPIRNGKVTVKAVSTIDGSVSATKEITITGQVVEVTGVSITSGNSISTDNGIIKMTAAVSPADAANKSVVWTIASADADTAAISNDTLTAIRNGKITIRATSAEDNSIYNEMEITITNQVVPIESIAISGDNITTNAGESQMAAAITPADADNVSIVWSLSSAADSAKATISSTGLITAFDNGSVTVVAKDANSKVQATKTINISAQVQVSEITLTAAGGSTAITESGGTLQISAQVGPAEARIKDIKWSVSDASKASVNKQGLVKAKANGEVYVIATATDAGAYADSIKITISNQVLVQSVDILVSIDTIDVNGAKLILPVNVSPDNAADTTVIWSIISDDADTATIDPETGEITPLRNGSIKVVATANGNSALKDSAIVVIINQVVEPNAISIIGTDNVSTIDVNNGTLQMIATVSPLDADPTIVWSIADDDSALATISETGLLKALSNGTVTVIATSAVMKTISDSTEIVISGQVTSVLVSSIAITADSNETSIDVKAGTLQLTATVGPNEASNKMITWSSRDENIATVSSKGLVTAVADGSVTITATAQDGSKVVGSINLTISNQTVGLDDEISNELEVYPNPASNRLYIRNLHEVAKIELVSTNGAIIDVTSEFKANSSINVSALRSGIYVIRAISEKQIYKAVIVKVNQ